MAEPKKCAHSSCSCLAPEGKHYCSESCETAKDVIDLVCQCHHPECQAEALK